MDFIDLFAGIGGFRKGMELAGHTCVGFCEIDKHAHNAYKIVHDTKGEWEAYDITTVTNESIRGIGSVDVITAGFPCQSFSVAGKRGGFNDTRGTLFFEIMRFADILRPRYLFLENVVGLLNHEGGATFETILRTMDEVGYDCEWDVLNSKDYGVPQNRERVFIVCHLRGSSTRKVFPLGEQDGETTRELMMVGLIDMKGNESIRRVYNSEGIAPTLTTMGGGHREPKVLVSAFLTPDREEKQQNGRRMKEPDEPMFTLTAQDRHGLYDGYRIRKLTPLECMRLQGFPDEWHFKLKEANISDSQLYKIAGNSVTINVIYEIAKRL
jgi:DNA (cytosine-5)-methyltransferase 1